MGIVLRADSGFCREHLMRWCEANGVDYAFGLARNPRLQAALAEEMAAAKRLCEASGKPARVFRDFRYETLDSWSRERRVVGKAGHTGDGANPRFVVTSLERTRFDARALYEDFYCARGEAENRIGEQFELFADRASSATMEANQLRMWFSAMAYVLVDTASRRPATHPVRRRRRRDHPPQALEARGSGAHQRETHPLRHRLGMSQQGRVRARPSLSSTRLQLRLSRRRSTRKAQPPFLRALTRASLDSHCARATTSRLALRETKKSESPLLRETSQIFQNQSFMTASTRAKLAAFEKSRLNAPLRLN